MIFKPQYRVVPHGTHGLWYQIERKGLFFWWKIRGFYNTKEQAEEDVKYLKEQDESNH